MLPLEQELESPTDLPSKQPHPPRPHFPLRRRRRRRRKLKCWVYTAAALMICSLYQYTSLMTLLMASKNRYYYTSYDEPSSIHDPTRTAAVHSTSRVILRDVKGNVVSRNTTIFSQYLSSTANNNKPPQAAAPPPSQADESRIVNGQQQIQKIQAMKDDRMPILAILRDAGIDVDKMAPTEIGILPTWQQVETLYGSEPVILGLEAACRDFQTKVPLSEHRYLGVSGMFNSGSTAFGISLQANCKFPRHAQNMSNDVLSDSNGMLDQVPWAKHKMATERYNHSVHDGIPKEQVLPIVLVRDPYYWMQSMCKQGYGARWHHDSEKHCPNLVPNDFDRKRFRKRLEKDAHSVPVWMGKNAQAGPSWPSLVHYWNAWYQSYLQAEFPRLMIRFEDTLFHGRQVMRQVCACGGGEPVSAGGREFFYLLDEAKWHHKQQPQRNMISAMIRYGTDSGRYRNMTKEDLNFARTHLDPTLLDLFHYRTSPP